MCFPRLYQRRVLCYDLSESIDSRQCPILKKSLRFVLNEFLVISLVDKTFEKTALCISRTLIGLRFGHYEIVARSLEERVPQEFFKTVSYTRLNPPPIFAKFTAFERPTVFLFVSPIRPVRRSFTAGKELTAVELAASLSPFFP